MKKIGKKIFVAIVATMMIFSVGITKTSANELDTSNTKDGLEVILYVSPTTDESTIEEMVEQEFENPEVTVVRVRESLVSMRANPDAGWVTNKETIYYMSVAYYAIITVKGYVTANNNVQNYSCNVSVSGYPVSLGSVTNYNTTSLSAYSKVIINLNGATPASYVYKAPLYGNIALW